ncbi:MAG: dihydropteroate synthase-like protein [Candidatus Thorarchaeota archaeon]
MKVLIITGQNSYEIIENIVDSVEEHDITVIKAPVSISAFLAESITSKILERIEILNFNIILLPGFVQWDTSNLEKKFSVKIRKGPEFASDLPIILKNLDNVDLSNSIPANRLLEISGENNYKEAVKEQLELSKSRIGNHTFYIRKEKSDLIIGKNLPPPIIAEIVNCTEKDSDNILKKVGYYIESGADIIDIGCVSNKPNPERIREIIDLIRSKYDVLLSIDSMDGKEMNTAVEEDIDLILSLDLGNYKEYLNLPKHIPIVILPTNLKKAYFPKEPEIRINNLLKLTKILQDNGFKKLIADPLLETPIHPGISNSLDAYFLYKKQIKKDKYNKLELPLFFGISNVVELMDIDSVGINGLLASIAIELDMGILFTVEHSTKLTGGVKELKESIKLNYIAKQKKTPPINQGISVFKAKGKISQKMPKIDISKSIIIDQSILEYTPDEKGYFRIFANSYTNKIYVLFYSNEDELLETIIGNDAETISKAIINRDLTTNIYHLAYLGRELKKAEICLFLGKPYIQDE